MMLDANIPEKVNPNVAQKAFETATKLDGLIPVKIDDVHKTRVEHFEGSIQPFAERLRTWGEAGTVKIRNKTTPKLGDRGITCMFVGYTQDHAGDCYEMLNMETKRIIQTRDVTWLGKMYFQADDGPEVNVNVNNDEEVTVENTIRRSERAIKAPRRLIEEMDSSMMTEEAMYVGAGIGGGFQHTSELIPMKYHEAMIKDPKGWGDAMLKEHERMKKHGVFQPIKKDQVPKNAKILTSSASQNLVNQ